MAFPVAALSATVTTAEAWSAGITLGGFNVSMVRYDVVLPAATIRTRVGLLTRLYGVQYSMRSTGTKQQLLVTDGTSVNLNTGYQYFDFGLGAPGPKTGTFLESVAVAPLATWPGTVLPAWNVETRWLGGGSQACTRLGNGASPEAYRIIATLPIDPTGIPTAPTAVTPGKYAAGRTIRDWSASTRAISSDATINGACHVGPGMVTDALDTGFPPPSTEDGPAIDFGGFSNQSKDTGFSGGSYFGSVYGPTGSRMWSVREIDYKLPDNTGGPGGTTFMGKKRIYIRQDGGVFSDYSPVGSSPDGRLFSLANSMNLTWPSSVFTAAYVPMTDIIARVAIPVNDLFGSGLPATFDVDFTFEFHKFDGSVTSTIGTNAASLPAVGVPVITAGVTAQMYGGDVAITVPAVPAGTDFYIVSQRPDPAGAFAGAYDVGNLPPFYMRKAEYPTTFLPSAAADGSVWWPGVGYKLGQF